MAETRKISIGDVRAQPDYLARAQAIPDTTNADGNVGAFLVGKCQGAVEIVARVESDINLTGTLTIKLQSSATEGGSYADINGASYAVVNPNKTAGTLLYRFPIPSDSNPWVKVNIASSATPTAAGGINVYIANVAR